MARKTKRDWFGAGTQIVLASGPQGLTIEALCQDLQVTKGSFYHHFGNYAGFKRQFLAFYEQEGTLDIISQLADLATAKEKLHGLLAMIVDFSGKQIGEPDVAMRAWALQDTAVCQVQMRVDGRRRAYVQTLCEEMMGDPAQAKTAAQMLYAILVGCEQMQPPIVGNDLRQLFNECLRLYGLD